MESKKKYVFAWLITGLLSGLIACSEKDKPVSDEDDPDPVTQPAPGFTKLKPAIGNINTVFFVNNSILNQ